MVRPYQEKFVGFIIHWYEVNIVPSSLKVMDFLKHLPCPENDEACQDEGKKGV
jgi:hypothetical protein